MTEKRITFYFIYLQKTNKLKIPYVYSCTVERILIVVASSKYIYLE